MGFYLQPSFAITEAFEKGDPIAWEDTLNELQEKRLWSRVDPKTISETEIDQLVFDFLDECVTTCINPIETLDEQRRREFIDKSMKELKRIKAEHPCPDLFQQLYESVQYLIEIIVHTFRSMVHLKIMEQLSAE